MSSKRSLPFERTARHAAAAISNGDFRELRRLSVHAVRVVGVKAGLIKKKKNGVAHLTKKGSQAENFRKLAEQRFAHWSLPAALVAVNRSIGMNPRDSSAYRLNCEILEMIGDSSTARTSALEAFRRDPLNPKSLTLLGKFFGGETLGRALDGIPDVVERRYWTRSAAINGVKALSEFGRGEQALQLLNDAFERGAIPDEFEAAYLAGIAHMRLREFEKAVTLFGKLFEHQSYGRASKIYAGDCLYELGRFDTAITIIESAYEGDDPSKPRGFNNPLFYMKFKLGRVRDAFLEARARGLTYAMREDVNGKYVRCLSTLAKAESSVVIADYGIGDEIRFASIYPDLSAKCSNLTITCEPRLHSLLKRSFPEVHFLPVTRWRGEMIVRNPETRAGVTSRRLTPVFSKAALDAAENAGAFTSIFEMLADTRPRLSSFGKVRSYLVPDERHVAKWAKRIPRNGSNIALSWRSVLNGARRDINYLCAADLAPLADVDGTFWIFQTAVETDELEILKSVLPNVRVIRGLDLMDDFEGMAGFLANMDAVVAPGNTTAELAGALGVPTVLFGRTEGSKWRAYADGRDVWHKSVLNVFGDPLNDPEATAIAIAGGLSKLIGKN